MEQQVKILGILHIVYGGLTLLTVGCLTLFFLAGMFVSVDQGAFIFLLFAFAIGGTITLFALPGIIGGIGLLGFRPWARIVILIVSAVALFNFPIGTALGAYTYWILLHTEAQHLFP